MSDLKVNGVTSVGVTGQTDAPKVDRSKLTLPFGDTEAQTAKADLVHYRLPMGARVPYGWARITIIPAIPAPGICYGQDGWGNAYTVPCGGGYIAPPPAYGYGYGVRRGYYDNWGRW